VNVERVVLCQGNLAEILEQDLKYFAQSVEKTNQRMLAEVRKFKKKVTSKRTTKRSNLSQIQGNRPEHQQTVPSSRTNLIS